MEWGLKQMSNTMADKTAREAESLRDLEMKLQKDSHDVEEVERNDTQVKNRIIIVCCKSFCCCTAFNSIFMGESYFTLCCDGKNSQRLRSISVRITNTQVQHCMGLVHLESCAGKCKDCKQ